MADRGVTERNEFCYLASALPCIFMVLPHYTKIQQVLLVKRRQTCFEIKRKEGSYCPSHSRVSIDGGGGGGGRDFKGQLIILWCGIFFASKLDPPHTFLVTSEALFSPWSTAQSFSAQGLVFSPISQNFHELQLS